MASNELLQPKVQWFLPREYDKLLKTIEEGDLLEFDHGGYIRRAVYVGWIDCFGKYCIVQATIPEDRNPEICMKSIISCKPLEDMLNHSSETRVRKNNFLDDTFYCYPCEEIVQRAKNSQENGYDLSKISNEHFVTWCRYKDHSALRKFATGTFSLAQAIIIKTKEIATSIGFFSFRFVRGTYDVGRNMFVNRTATPISDTTLPI